MKVPRQCPFFLLVGVASKEGKVLRSEEDEAMESGILSGYQAVRSSKVLLIIFKNSVSVSRKALYAVSSVNIHLCLMFSEI
jgi:hypothetical protein